jgi:hypothetical protein
MSSPLAKLGSLALDQAILDLLARDSSIASSEDQPLLGLPLDLRPTGILPETKLRYSPFKDPYTRIPGELHRLEGL